MTVLKTVQKQRLIELHAYVIMANHVHVLLTPAVSLSRITQRVKGPTSRYANQLLGFTGTHFWQDESFDHWVRNPAEWQKIKKYIENNPVAAGLVARPQDWRWSSASRPLQ